MKLFKNKDIISMEFNNDTIKLVTGRYERDRLSIHKSITIDLPNEVYTNGEIIDFQQLSYIIKMNLEKNDIRIKNLHMLLNSDKIIVRELVIPKLEEENYEEFLDYNIKDYLPVDRDEYMIKHMVIDPIFNHNDTRLLVAAAPRVMVKEYYDLINHIGLNPLVFDIVGNCISKYLNYKKEFNLVAAIGIDYATTNIVISRYGQLKYSKIIDRGYKKLTEGLVDIELDKEDILEILKEEHPDENSEINNKIHLLNQSFQRELLNQIESILKYYLEGEEIDRIYLYDDYSSTYKVKEAFANYFNKECSSLDELNDSDIDVDLSRFANCIGGIIRL